MLRGRSLVGDPEVEAKVLEVIRKAGIPVSIDYVAHQIGVSWHTARSILLKLAAEGKVKAINTTKSFVFALPGML